LNSEIEYKKGKLKIMSLKISFLPQEIGKKYENNPPRKLNIWFFIAILSLWIRIYIASVQAGGIWSIKEQEELEIPFDLITCFLISCLFILILWLIQTITLIIVKIKRPSRYVKASMCVFIFIPLFSLPIHSMFPNGATKIGALWIVIILIFLFIIWNISVLGILLNSSKKAKKIKIVEVMLILFIEELILIFIFFTKLPPLFKSTTIDFLLQWF